MAEYNKEKYYWFKLKDDFFKRHDIKIIKSMPNGKDYVIFYLQLLCESLSHNGKLRFNEEIPYSEEMLSVITDTNIDVVRSAMKLFEQLKLVEIMDDQTIFMTKLQSMIGSTTIGAEKKQIQLERKRQELLVGGTKVEKIPPDIDKEIDIEKDINNNLNKQTYITNDVGLFNAMLEELKENVSPIAYKSFIGKIGFCGIKENRIVIQSDTPEMIDNNYSNTLIQAIRKVSNGQLVGYSWGNYEEE